MENGHADANPDSASSAGVHLAIWFFYRGELDEVQSQ